jgi:hypothetical protein
MNLNHQQISQKFDFISDRWDKKMIVSAYIAIDKVPDDWDYLKTFVTGEDGFMFSRDKRITEITDRINKEYSDGHSGLSMAYTMRAMESIAKNGFDKYKADYMKNCENEPL